MPYGRGGAGNFQALEQDKSRAAADLEANQPTIPHTSSSPSAKASYTEKPQQQYAHTGRGGAGNYYSPKELNQTGHWNDINRSHILGDGTLAPTSAPGVESGSPSYGSTVKSKVEQPTSITRTVGRGGAGNYMFGVGESEEEAARKRIEEDKRREMVKEEVERDVEGMLAVPPKARLPRDEGML